MTYQTSREELRLIGRGICEINMQFQVEVIKSRTQQTPNPLIIYRQLMDINSFQ